MTLAKCGEINLTVGDVRLIIRTYKQRHRYINWPALYHKCITILKWHYRHGNNGQRFYEYNQTFSREAASHLRYQNKLVNWSIRNNTLFCNIFSNLRPETCDHCKSTLHGSDFCIAVARRSYYPLPHHFMPGYDPSLQHQGYVTNVPTNQNVFYQQAAAVRIIQLTWIKDRRTMAHLCIYSYL